MNLASIVLRVANHCSVLVLGEAVKSWTSGRRREGSNRTGERRYITEGRGGRGGRIMVPRRPFQLLVANLSARVAGPWGIRPPQTVAFPWPVSTLP